MKTNEAMLSSVLARRDAWDKEFHLSGKAVSRLVLCAACAAFVVLGLVLVPVIDRLNGGSFSLFGSHSQAGSWEKTDIRAESDIHIVVNEIPLAYEWFAPSLNLSHISAGSQTLEEQPLSVYPFCRDIPLFSDPARFLPSDLTYTRVFTLTDDAAEVMSIGIFCRTDKEIENVRYVAATVVPEDSADADGTRKLLEKAKNEHMTFSVVNGRSFPLSCHTQTDGTEEYALQVDLGGVFLEVYTMGLSLDEVTDILCAATWRDDLYSTNAKIIVNREPFRDLHETQILYIGLGFDEKDRVPFSLSEAAAYYRTPALADDTENWLPAGMTADEAETRLGYFKNDEKGIYFDGSTLVYTGKNGKALTVDLRSESGIAAALTHHAAEGLAAYAAGKLSDINGTPVPVMVYENNDGVDCYYTCFAKDGGYVTVDGNGLTQDEFVRVLCAFTLPAAPVTEAP